MRPPRPNSVSWNLAVDGVQHFPWALAGVALVGIGGAVMALFRPLVGEWSMMALSISAGGVVFLVVKTVRAVRMSARVADGRLVVWDLWSSSSVDVEQVHSIGIVERLGMELVEVQIGEPSRSLVVPSWPPECVDELAELLRAAGSGVEVRPAAMPTTATGHVDEHAELEIHPMVAMLSGSDLRFGDDDWRRAVYRSEHLPERLVMWAVGLASLVWWTETFTPWALTLVVVAALGLVGLARRSRRIAVRADGNRLRVSNYWRTHYVELDQPVRLTLVGGTFTLLIRLVTGNGGVVVEAAPWADPAGLAPLIERAGGSVEVSYGLQSDPPSGDFSTGESFWRRALTVY